MKFTSCRWNSIFDIITTWGLCFQFLPVLKMTVWNEAGTVTCKLKSACWTPAAEAWGWTGAAALRAAQLCIQSSVKLDSVCRSRTGNICCHERVVIVIDGPHVGEAQQTRHFLGPRQPTSQVWSKWGRILRYASHIQTSGISRYGCATVFEPFTDLPGSSFPRTRVTEWVLFACVSAASVY